MLKLPGRLAALLAPQLTALASWGGECSRLLAALRTRDERPSHSGPFRGWGGGCGAAERTGLGVAESAALYAPQVSEVEEPEDILAEERQRLQARALQRQQSSMARSSMETYGAFQGFSAPEGAS